MKSIRTSAFAIAMGLLLIGGAIFANQIGLDHNESWGKGRFMLLVVGALILLAPFLPFDFKQLREFFRARRTVLQVGLTYLLVILCGILPLLAFAWFAGAGGWTRWPATTNYYDRLARAFHEGSLSIDSKFLPALLALPDPYEPDARRDIQGLVDEQGPDRIWDMSLYKGRIFLYWGPAPAVLLDLAKFLYVGEVGDQYLTFAFVSGLYIFEFLLLLRLWRRFFPELPLWLVLPASLLIAFINPIPWVLNIPRIYEAAIASDQCFFMGGLYFAVSALDRPTHSRGRLVLAGLLWVLAVGSRVTMALPISWMALAVLYRIIHRSPAGMTSSQRLSALAGLLVPMLAGAAALAWYNLARFDSVAESGLRYAITMINQNDPSFYNLLFSPKYILPNLYLYLFNPPMFSGVFPFIKPVWSGEFILNFDLSSQTIYNAERITGLIYTTPFSLFALIPAATLLADFIGRRGHRRDPGPAEVGEQAGFLQWLLVTLLGALVLEFVTVLLVFYGTMRYFMDVTPTLALLSVLGFWQGYQLLGRRGIGRGWYLILAFVLLAISIGVSLLLAFSSDIGRIRANNPSLLPHLKLFFMRLLNFVGN